MALVPKSPQTRATAQDALQATANDQILCLAAIQSYKQPARAMHAHETAFLLQPAQQQGQIVATEAKVRSSFDPLFAWQETPQCAAWEYRPSCSLPLAWRHLVPMQHNFVDRRDAFFDPPHGHLPNAWSSRQ